MSIAHKVTSVGAMLAAGPPQGERAPSGGSAVHEVTSVGAMLAAGPPQGERAPSGGSAVHEVTSVGAMLAAGPPQGERAPSGGSAVHEVTSVGATCSRLVLFDLDHTLLPIDSDYSWGVFTTQIGWTDPVEFGRRNDEFFAHYKAGTLDIHDYVRFATDAVRLRGEAEALAARERFMEEVVRPAMNTAAVDLVRHHQDAGDEVVIITATNEFVTRPIADAFGVRDLIAVELERGAGGWISGEIKGVPSAREGKVTRMEQWLAARGTDWAGVHSIFYTDSINDLSLMEKVNQPVATNPDDRLRVIAGERGWRILDLFQKIS